MKTERLGQVTKNLDNKRIPLNSEERLAKSKKGLYPYIGANNIVAYIDEYIFDETILCVAEDGGSWGANQKCAEIYEGKTWVNNHAHVLVENGKADLKYIKNYLNYANLNKFIKGSTRGKLNKSVLENIPIPLPSLPAQRLIAQLLSQAEQLIAQRQESLRLLDAYLKSTFLEMFGDPVRNEMHWNRVELKLHAKVRIGPFGSLLHREDYVRDGIPMVNPSHIQAGKIVIDPGLTISKAKMNELSAYVMRAGDVVLGRRGEIGRCAVVTDKENGYLCGTGSIFIRPTEELNPIFLYNVISSASMRRVLESSAKGITMKNLNSGIIENLKIPVPPISIQTQFAQIEAQTELLKTLYQQSLAELEQMYGSLSQRAFRGELGGAMLEKDEK